MSDFGDATTFACLLAFGMLERPSGELAESFPTVCLASPSSQTFSQSTCPARHWITVTVAGARAFITMMMGAMNVPVVTACLVEQAEVAADVVAGEQEPAEQAASPARKKCKLKLLTTAEKRMKPVLWDHHNSFLDANGGDLTIRAEQLAAKIESQYGWPAADGRGRAVWCEACKKVQPLHREFDAWAWNKHVTSQAHKKAVCELERERMSMANWGMCA